MQPATETLSQNQASTSAGDEKEEQLDPLYLWKSIALSLGNVGQVRSVSNENLSSIQRLHTKIQKNPKELWNVKTGKKCKKLYNQALEKVIDENRLIGEVIANIKKLSAYLRLAFQTGSSLDVTSGTKRRHLGETVMDDASAAGDAESPTMSSPNTAAGLVARRKKRKIAPGSPSNSQSPIPLEIVVIDGDSATQKSPRGVDQVRHSPKIEMQIGPVIQPGTRVAAPIKDPENQTSKGIVWFLGLVKTYDPLRANAGKPCYEIVDAEHEIEIDDEIMIVGGSDDSSRVRRADSHYNWFRPDEIIQLPPMGLSSAESQQQMPSIAVGDCVLAMYPDSTCFYLANVEKVPVVTDSNWTSAKVIVSFDEDSGQHRPIAFWNVAPIPKELAIKDSHERAFESSERKARGGTSGSRLPRVGSGLETVEPLGEKSGADTTHSALPKSVTTSPASSPGGPDSQRRRRSLRNQ